MPATKTKGKGVKPDKLMRDAISVALHREAAGADGKPTKRLNLVASRLVDEAVGGNIQAIKEINDRMDGRVPQEDQSQPGWNLTQNFVVRLPNKVEDITQWESQAQTQNQRPVMIEAKTNGKTQ